MQNILLSREAAKKGKPIKSLLHEVLFQHIQAATSLTPPLTNREIQEYLYREGIIDHIPTGEPDKPEVEAERERLARLFGFGYGKPASEMVIEDRGPR